MMNKKSIALTLSVATVATSVAPAFAAKVDETANYDVNINDAGKLVSKVRELLNVKFDDKTSGPVYTIESNYKLVRNSLVKSNTTISNATELANIINAVDEEVLTIKITDNGHDIVDGKVVGEETKHYDNVLDLKTAYDAIKSAIGAEETNEDLNDKLNDTVAIINEFDNKVGKTKLDIIFDVKLNQDTTLESVKEQVKDLENVTVEGKSFSAGKFARVTKSLIVEDGSELVDESDVKIIVGENETDDVTTINLDNIEEVEGFKLIDPQDIEKKELAIVNLSNAKLNSIESNKLFDGLMLSEEGKKLANINGSTIEIDGDKFTISTTVSPIEEVVKDKEYKMNIAFKKTQIFKGSLTEGAFEELTITAGSREELENLTEVLADSTKAVNDLVGANRFETAIKVSNELFPEGNAAKSIVLVEKDSIVDGLAATPLATMTEAPVLFTDKTSVPTDVVEEMKRALDIKSIPVGKLEDTTVYVVGGDNKIDDSVIAQIKKELGVTVKRLAGNSRTETSVKIAEEMKAIAKKNSTNINDKVFVVGRDGEADAMSIAGYAASQKSPIIVADRTELTDDAVDFISKEAQTADIIGGNTVVNTDIEAKLVEILDNKKDSVERVEGSRRAETNANVINKYYKTGVKEIIVAKDGKAKMSDLSDSLVAGPLAAAKNAPIVLSTTDLDVNQEEVLDLRASNATKLTQVGGGVSRTIIEKLAKIVGLVK